jgi:Ran GTPase-activating protein (RanGAP) involved in mRNA processing and transport
LSEIKISIKDISEEAMTAFIGVFKSCRLESIGLITSSIPLKSMILLYDELKNYEYVRKLIFKGFCNLPTEEFKLLCDIITANHNIKCLDYSCNDINKVSFDYLADILKINKSLEELNLEECCHTNAFDKFADALKVNKTLKKLNLSYLRISENDVKLIGDALGKNKGLEEINLRKMYIKDHDIKYIIEPLKKNTTLKVLNLSKNDILDECVINVMDLLKVNKTLEKIELNPKYMNADDLELIRRTLIINKLISDNNF